MSKFQLRLPRNDETAGENGTGQRFREFRAEPKGPPVAGYFAVGCGVLGIFGPAILFTPLALIFSLVALLRGQPLWFFAGLLLVVGGILGSPLLMGAIGLGAMYMTFDWQEILRPLYDMFGGGVDV